MLGFSKEFMKVVGAILLTGAVLKVAGDGTLGTTAQKAAKFVTSGYGV